MSALNNEATREPPRTNRSPPRLALLLKMSTRCSPRTDPRVSGPCIRSASATAFTGSFPSSCSFFIGDANDRRAQHTHPLPWREICNHNADICLPGRTLSPSFFNRAIVRPRAAAPPAAAHLGTPANRLPSALRVCRPARRRVRASSLEPDFGFLRPRPRHRSLPAALHRQRGLLVVLVLPEFPRDSASTLERRAPSRSAGACRTSRAGNHSVRIAAPQGGPEGPLRP